MGKWKCKICGDIIESKFRHDFQTCKCGCVSVDGGSEYTSLSFPAGMTSEDWIENIEEDSHGSSTKI